MEKKKETTVVYGKTWWSLRKGVFPSFQILCCCRERLEKHSSIACLENQLGKIPGYPEGLFSKVKEVGA